MLIRGSKQKKLLKTNRLQLITYKNVDTNLIQIKHILSRLGGILSEIALLTLLPLRIRKKRYCKVQYSCRHPVGESVAVYKMGNFVLRLRNRGAKNLQLNLWKTFP